MSPPSTRGPLPGGIFRAWLPVSSLLGFSAAVLAVVVIAAISVDALRERSASARRVTQTMRLTHRIDQVLTYVSQAENAQRGFVITSDVRYLEPYERAQKALPSLLESLRAAMKDEPAQAQRFADVERLATERMAALAVVIGHVQAGERDVGVAGIRSGQGRALMDDLRSAVAALGAAERDRLEQRTHEWESTASASNLITWAGSLLLLILIGGAAGLSSRDFRAQRVEAWLRSGQTQLATRMQGELTLEQVGEHVVGFLAEYLGARLGALYFLTGDGLRRVGAYGLPALAANQLAPAAAGLTAEAMKARGPMLVDAPPGYFQVSSGLGQTAPVQLLLCPTYVDGAPNAVLELGFLERVYPHHLELLGRVGETVASALRSARYRKELVDLLEETRRQAEELQTQQEELRVNNEELEQQRRALQESQSRLQNQQSELEQINSQLEEQTTALEAQRDDLTRAQGELTRANTYKSEFLANMSHELRTPLNSSLILAKLLIDNRHGNLTEEQVKYAQTIYSAGNDLLTLINDILDLSKIEAGKLDVRPEDVAVTRVLTELEDTFRPIACEKGLELELHVERGTPATLHTDPLRLNQVLKNLVSNALKFTERGVVSVGVAPAGGAGNRVVFAVKDTGIGIAREQQDIIFEAFRQADGTTNRKHGGTGLGLSISRDLARLLGGEVRLESAPGRGSTFYLEVPAMLQVAERGGAAPPNSRPALRATVPVPAAGGALPAGEPQLPMPLPDDRGRLAPGARTLLIVEDDLAFARIVQELARERGFLTLVANTAEDGLKLASRHPPSAVVLDVNLPDRSGLSVLDALKHSPRTRHVPVHMCSVADHGHAALAMGATGYVLKPVVREQVVDALKKLESKLTQKVQRVLVVEDDELHRASTQALLQADGVETVGVANADEALKTLKAQTVDCMVLDLTLPGRSGFELLEEMTLKQEYQVPPVIVYTGKALKPEEEQRLRRFSSSIIIKGAKSPERLLDEVTLFLHQVEEELPPDRRRMLQDARHRESVFEGRRLLVVEDDVRNIFALSSALEPRGAKVEIARNGREALEHIEKRPGVDLVLMDIMMPEMDGLTAIRAIRSKPEHARLPIIALTAKAMADDRDSCLAAGANDYIAKPIDVDKLLSLVRVWMPR